MKSSFFCISVGKFKNMFIKTYVSQAPDLIKILIDHLSIEQF